MSDPTQPTVVEQAQEAASKLASVVSDKLNLGTSSSTGPTSGKYCLNLVRNA